MSDMHPLKPPATRPGPLPWAPPPVSQVNFTPFPPPPPPAPPPVSQVNFTPFPPPPLPAPSPAPHPAPVTTDDTFPSNSMSPTPTPSPEAKSEGHSNAALAGIVVAILFALLAFVGSFAFFRKRRKSRRMREYAMNDCSAAPPSRPKDREPHSGSGTLQIVSTVSSQARIESIKIAQDGNPLLVSMSSSGSLAQPLAPTVPSEKQPKPNQPPDEENPLPHPRSPYNKPHTGSRTQQVVPTVPSQAPASPPPRVLEFPHLPKEFKDYEELRSATGGFSESNRLGQGGFGTVYKGVLPPDNKTVAIKKLNPYATQGKQEFLTEAETISRAHHRHIVSLVGYYIGPDEAHKDVMMLVYEYIPNNSLDSHLRGAGTETIDWETRMKIAIGSAKGLRYLHEDCKPKIIHRDIKSSNILLLDDFQPKIADFGLAKPLSDTVTHESLQQVAGTVGYLAPEYFVGGRMSEKSDVYAFGVVLLELITGQKPCGSVTDGIVKWARPKLFAALNSEERNFEALADPRLQNKYNSEEMFRMVSCAANCVRDLASHRPRMSQVVDALEGKIHLDNRGEVSPQGGGELWNMVREMALNGVDGSSSCQNGCENLECEGLLGDFK